MTDGLLRQATLAALLASLALLALVVGYVASQARLPPASGMTLADYWLFADWHPVGNAPTYGIVHAWVATLMIVGAALAVALPIALLIGVFLSDFAPAVVRNIVDPTLQLLAGLPAVVYGFVGYVTLVPLLERFLPTGETVLVAALVLAVMMLPYAAATAAESFAAVPGELRTAGLALGTSRWYIFTRITLRAAAPGVLAGAILGMARGLGETLAVLMLAGNSPLLPAGLLDRAQPLTALIATDLGESAVGSDRYAALYGAGLTLMAGVLLINALVFHLKRRVMRGVAG